MGKDRLQIEALTLIYNITENRLMLVRGPVQNIESIANTIVDADRNDTTSKSIEAIKVCKRTYSDNAQLEYEKNNKIF